MQDATPRIAIIGDGVVGGALRAWFDSQGRDARPYDPPRGLGDIAVLDRADLIFICVPTPYAPVRGFDEHYLLDAVRAIPGGKLVIVKSTVRPGTTEHLQRDFPQHRFMFNPEFLREATAVADMMAPDRQIVGVTPESAADAELVLALLPPAPFTSICAAREAEMAKYVANSFLATKVSFANEIYDLCGRIGIDYDAVREMVGADPRIGPSHMDVLDAGYRGYGGKCLPKDSKALLDLAASAGMDLQVLRATDAVNETLIAVRPAKQRRTAAHTVETEAAPDVQREERAA